MTLDEIEKTVNKYIKGGSKMAKCTICDYKNCGEQINEDAVDKEFELVSDEGTISITLSPDKDFCQECSRKAKNKLSMLANAALKKPRAKKEG